ncbi:MAG: hypothetical protein PVH38_02515 [Gammaproteobacteria bacterium]
MGASLIAPGLPDYDSEMKFTANRCRGLPGTVSEVAMPGAGVGKPEAGASGDAGAIAG